MIYQCVICKREFMADSDSMIILNTNNVTQEAVYICANCTTTQIEISKSNSD